MHHVLNAVFFFMPVRNTKVRGLKEYNSPIHYTVFKKQINVQWREQIRLLLFYFLFIGISSILM